MSEFDVDAKAITSAIYWKYRSSSWAIAPCYTPHGWYEADVWAITNARYSVEFEIKLTPGDFRADAQKRGPRLVGSLGAVDLRSKHDRLAARDANGPSRFWFVVPSGLVEDVPEWAGLIHAMPFNGRVHLRGVRKAPQLHRHPIEDAEAEVRRIHQRLYHRFWQARAGATPQGATP